MVIRIRSKKASLGPPLAVVCACTPVFCLSLYKTLFAAANVGLLCLNSIFRSKCMGQAALCGLTHAERHPVITWRGSPTPPCTHDGGLTRKQICFGLTSLGQARKHTAGGFIPTEELFRDLIKRSLIHAF